MSAIRIFIIYKMQGFLLLLANNFAFFKKYFVSL